jgi:hypothetical protein
MFSSQGNTGYNEKEESSEKTEPRTMEENKFESYFY